MSMHEFAGDVAQLATTACYVQNEDSRRKLEGSCRHGNNGKGTFFLWTHACVTELRKTTCWPYVRVHNWTHPWVWSRWSWMAKCGGGLLLGKNKAVTTVHRRCMAWDWTVDTPALARWNCPRAMCCRHDDAPGPAKPSDSRVIVPPNIRVKLERSSSCTAW
jgi:hypothetical protein